MNSESLLPLDLAEQVAALLLPVYRRAGLPTVARRRVHRELETVIGLAMADLEEDHLRATVALVEDAVAAERDLAARRRRPSLN